MQDISQILDYIMKLKGFTKVSELAKLFNVGDSTPSSWRNRGTIPFKKISAICKDEGWDFQEILLGGQKKALYKQDDKIIFYTGEGDPIYLTKETGDLLNMAAEILTSDYSNALAANIRAFYTAIQDKKDISDLKKRVNSLEKKGIGNATAGSGSQSHTGAATEKKET